MVEVRSKRGACDNCRAVTTLQHVTVRMYTKRSQLEFRYRLCPDDVRLLETLLEGTASIVQRGIFDHNAKLEEPFVRKI